MREEVPTLGEINEDLFDFKNKNSGINGFSEV